MDTLSYKTVSANNETAEKEWVLVNLDGETLGRAASKIAKLLRGKYKANYTPHVDCGDYVVVINADKVKMTGKKWQQKEYVRYTGYQGGLRRRDAITMWKKFPERIIENAVKGMLPKNKLGSKIFNNLKVYAGAEHKNEAQKPKEIKLDSIR